METTAYIPGEGHALQEHFVVLVGGAGSRTRQAYRSRSSTGALDAAGVSDRSRPAPAQE